MIAPQRYLLKAIQVLTHIIFRHMNDIRFKRKEFMRSVLSTNTDIFFTHQRQQEFLTQLRNSELDKNDIESMSSSQSREDAKGLVLEFDDGQEDIAEHQKTFKDEINLHESSQSLVIPPSTTPSTSLVIPSEPTPPHLLNRYLGNSRPSLEIEIESENNSDDDDTEQ